MLSVHKCPDTERFRDSNNPAFCYLEFQNEITSETHLFFQSISNVMQILEMQQKTKKMFFDLDIIAFELVALDTRFY